MKVTINAIGWEVFKVDANHAGLYVNGEACVGTTWPAKAQIYIADNQSPGKMLLTIRHELVHAYINSTQIREPRKCTEEDICEFVAMYADAVLSLAEKIFKELQEEKQ